MGSSEEPAVPSFGKLLGIDYGRRRIGVAASDETQSIAMPVRRLDVRSDDEAVRETARVAADSDAVGIVVGMPVNMNGTHGEMAVAADGFAARLRRVSCLPVVTWDERLTSAAAERCLLEGDISRGRRKELRDKLAAQILLQGYLDSRVGGSGSGGG
ncbi:MAG: Holliday junction resolvase RuvX [Lentisphaerae bacterium]|nr:Holliday junction resolvase RuvX [Lentisphaerota bacterium]